MILRRIFAWLTCYALAVGAFVLLTGCATLEDKANTTALADNGTTIGALALGATEANPLGLAALVLKWPILRYIDTLPDDERAQGQAVVSAMWGGAAVNNVCVMVAILSAGTFAPACLLGGIGWGIYAWSESAAEREFYAACAEYRRVSGEQFRCVYRNEGVIDQVRGVVMDAEGRTAIKAATEAAPKPSAFDPT